ncbi:hypothetical protein GDO78_004493 [Eleutherodactylus coqui]|uniref:Uncharacterized protein n=1 Tax=Eleutherodactylus coqui TaxID=57060 RepID=A0A8J6K3R1_ELECQ|nr:hypothetical protein GDO78_004493 [Eleutherodactylus coqui]
MLSNNRTTICTTGCRIFCSSRCIILPGPRRTLMPTNTIYVLSSSLNIWKPSISHLHIYTTQHIILHASSAPAL